MKKSLLVILGVVAVGIVYSKVAAEKPTTESSSFSYNPDLGLYIIEKEDFVYKMESRFIETISKEKLQAAQSILDIFPAKATQGIDALENVSISLVKDENEKFIFGENEILNAAQLALIKSINYADGINVRGTYKVKNGYTGKLQDKLLTYHLTVVPEQEAVYKNGHDSFISFLKANSLQKSMSIDNKKVGSGRINFTVNTAGQIENIILESSCGYKDLDKDFQALIGQIPGNWEPARNAKGAKVDQEFVFFFGNEGC